MSALLQAIWSVVLELAPWLLVGAAVAGLLHKFLPPGFLERRLRGTSGVFQAVLFGVPLPLCSCGVIPAGVGLKKDGASDGASIAFLTSTPQTGVDSILVSAGFLGWPFALFKVVAAAVTGVAAGLITEAASPAPPVDAAVVHHHAPARTWAQAWDHGVDVLRSIWGWLAFGILASAVLTVFVPPSACRPATRTSASSPGSTAPSSG